MIMLIDENGSKIGNIGHAEAQNIAKSKELDLILVNKENQVYKLGDLGKIKYDKKQKAKKNKLNKKNNKVKEIQLRPTIDVGDLNIKVKKIKDFLQSGFKTKIVMRFKRHQMVYKEIGIKKIDEIVKGLADGGLISENSPYKTDNRQIIVFLTPLDK